ncbi:MAG: arylamine N-acetyltransferase [Sulfuricellaceae bacterium]|nr:arylamine N-acetyltransferase [Sulfuricellaceae bacterium]
MKAENFVLQNYFDRIGFHGDAATDIASISEIMRCQLFTVPFENLDVQAGKIVSLVPEEIVEKIVERRRGGYCYEVNGLFAMALQALGIPYQFVAARPMIYAARRPRTHMAIVLKADGEEWLCDLGFGSYGIRAPIRLNSAEAEIRQDFDTFALSNTNGREYLLRALVEGEWANQYAFDLSEHEWIDFMPANYLNSTHPDALFVQKLLVVLHTPEGREILLDNTLKTVFRGQIEKQAIRPEDRAAILRDKFRLVANA